VWAVFDVLQDITGCTVDFLNRDWRAAFVGVIADLDNFFEIWEPLSFHFGMNYLPIEFDFKRRTPADKSRDLRFRKRCQNGIWQFPVARSITSPTTVFNFHFDWLRHFQWFPLNCFYLNRICENKKYFELSCNFHIESMIYLNFNVFQCNSRSFYWSFYIINSHIIEKFVEIFWKNQTEFWQEKTEGFIFLWVPKEFHYHLLLRQTSDQRNWLVSASSISYCCIFSSLSFDWKFCLWSRWQYNSSKIPVEILLTKAAGFASWREIGRNLTNT